MLQQKLIENRNRRRRDLLLSELTDDGLRQLLLEADYSHDANSIKYSAFPTWSSENSDYTTTRGHVASWKKSDYTTWDEVILSLQKVSQVENVNGWLFFEVDGPYYKIDFHDFKTHLLSLCAYVASKATYDLGWVAANSDCGIIVEFEHTFFCKNDFCVCTW